MNNIYIETLGCAKNKIDSEMMYFLMSDYKMTEYAEDADIIIINTCGFIDAAVEESIMVITEFLNHKLNGKCSMFIVAGCLVERYPNELKKELPEVDIFVGTTQFIHLNDIVKKYDGKQKVFVGSVDILIPEDIKRVKTSTYSSYLKISEGCDNNCTYCIIPKLRGRYRSRKHKDILNEAKALVESGTKEIIIIAQDTIRYGSDLYGKNTLPKLLSDICKIEGLKWLRLMYAYPDEIDEELVLTFKNEEKLINYIDMPIQHGSNSVLKRMNRHTSSEQIRDVVTMFRKHIPDMVIRTTIIVGFPGETDKEYDELYQLVDELKFDRLGVFKFSPQEGTPAFKMKNHVEEYLMDERFENLMELQRGISYENNEKYLDQIIEVVVEEHIEDNLYGGRSIYDAPEIDNGVYIKGENLNIGDILKIKVDDFMEYDLFGGVYELS